MARLRLETRPSGPRRGRRARALRRTRRGRARIPRRGRRRRGRTPQGRRPRARRTRRRAQLGVASVAVAASSSSQSPPSGEAHASRTSSCPPVASRTMWRCRGTREAGASAYQKMGSPFRVATTCSTPASTTIAATGTGSGSTRRAISTPVRASRARRGRHAPTPGGACTSRGIIVATRMFCPATRTWSTRPPCSGRHDQATTGRGLSISAATEHAPRQGRPDGASNRLESWRTCSPSTSSPC